jgi:hypothetical protein
MACKWLEICPLRELEKQGKISKKWRESYCESEENWKNCKRFQIGRGEYKKIFPDGSKIK